jgi:hypothetical protein
MLVVVGMFMLVGCGPKNRDAELKAYVAGCSENAHYLIEQVLGQSLNEDKLKEFCNKAGQEWLKSNK